jgi:hypothetical protein
MAKKRAGRKTSCVDPEKEGAAALRRHNFDQDANVKLWHAGCSRALHGRLGCCVGPQPDLTGPPQCGPKQFVAESRFLGTGHRRRPEKRR